MSCFSSPARRAPGFTLIELLVVVAIIALLISILLPTLARAREQARTVKCLANLKTIGNAMHMYFSENREWFPFEKRAWPAGGTTWALSAFGYGGHPGRPNAFEFVNLTHRYAFTEKPLNLYVGLEGLPSTVETNAEVGTAEFEERRKAMEMFVCPSDTGGFFQGETFVDSSATQAIHYLHGASYDINYHFVWLWAAGSGSLGGPWPPYSVPADQKSQYLQRANKFLAAQREKHVSRFVVLYEDPFDSSQWNQLPRFGWHRQLNKHSFLFLDGHAANIYADVKAGNSGPGWKTAGHAWYNDVNDPDYPLRTLKP